MCLIFAKKVPCEIYITRLLAKNVGVGVQIKFFKGKNSNYELSVQIAGVKLNLKALICQANSNEIFEGHNYQALKFKHINQLFKKSKINTPIRPFFLRVSIKTYKTRRQRKKKKQSNKRKQGNKKKQSNRYNITTSSSLVYINHQ